MKSSLSRLSPTPVFDTYWRFAAERQAIFFRRLEGSTPFTTDPILSHYKFTNAYRASDRVSQYLIREVIYSGPQTPEELFFRIILFKLFNRIETWEMLKNNYGEIAFSNFSLDAYDAFLNECFARGERLYAAAYIMPAARVFESARKHTTHLRLLAHMMHERVYEKLAAAESMKSAFKILRSYPMMGNFLAYQYLIDLNYSTLLNFSEMDFVVAGPGARNGIRKCFADPGTWSPEDIIRTVTESQVEEFAAREIIFQSLFGRPLQLIDCQNIFCEVDKYSRVAHPEMQGVSGRTRIKQVFTSKGELPKLFFPPKWELDVTTRE